MPNFRYRALTQAGEIVTGSITAPSVAEVAHRIEYLGLMPIETTLEDGSAALSSFSWAMFSRPKAEDVTIFTRDLALLLKAGARLDDGLDLLANDMDVGRLRPTVVKIRAAILGGESFAEALGRHPALFPAMYVALVRVGEMSGTLDHVLEMLGNERVRAEALRRKLTDALHYPAFVLLAAGGVLVFFVVAVLPQFSSVLRDFNAKTDPVIETFLALSDLLRGHGLEIALAAAALVVGCWLAWRRPGVRASVVSEVSRLPGVATVFGFHRTALFCRNLGILLGSGVTLTATLRILVDIMAVTGSLEVWTAMADRVRHGGKLSDALAVSAILPPMAVRMLRLGEETGQLPALSGRVADFYEAKLQRHLDRIVGIIGPLAIVVISIVVGGLIVSVMTALLSVSQIVG
ncbi:MAG: type II secretion system F family protein [Methylacidiphilales bacterium]|nr:type II secretion system F family protein [Candidatus Methylacidiphilales bacterium]